MSKSGTAAEPSVDDILTSIRKEIAENPSAGDGSLDPLVGGADFAANSASGSAAGHREPANKMEPRVSAGNLAADARSTLRDRLSDALGRSGSPAIKNTSVAGVRSAPSAARDEVHGMLDDMVSRPSSITKPLGKGPAGDILAKSPKVGDADTEPTTIVVPASDERSKAESSEGGATLEAESLDFSALLGSGNAARTDSEKTGDQIADIPLNSNAAVEKVKSNGSTPDGPTMSLAAALQVDQSAKNSNTAGFSGLDKSTDSASAVEAKKQDTAPQSPSSGIGFVTGPNSLSGGGQETNAAALKTSSPESSLVEGSKSEEPRSMAVLSPTSQARSRGAAALQTGGQLSDASLAKSIADTPSPDVSEPVAALNPSASALDALVVGLATSNLAVAQEEAKKSSNTGGSNAENGLSAVSASNSVGGKEPGSVMVKLPTDQQTLNAAREASRVSMDGLEQTVTELLRPMLREWLEANMPRIVENALRIEVSQSADSGDQRT